MKESSTESCWRLFKGKVASAVEECVPKKLRRNSSKPLWMRRNVLRTLRKKRRLWKQYTLSQDYQSYLAYKQVQKAANAVVKKAKKNFEKELAADIKKNPKAFYSYINSRCKVQSRVGPLKDVNGHVQTDDSIQAKILNNQFSSAFTKEDLSYLPVPEPVSYTHLTLPTKA